MTLAPDTVANVAVCGYGFRLEPSALVWMLKMRLKTALWVAAYLRRCHVEGVFAVVRRRGAEEAGAVFVRICRLNGTSDLFGPAPQSAFDATAETARAFTPSLATQSAPDADVEAYLARQLKFDPDVWIVEVEDREGHNFLDIVAG